MTVTDSFFRMAVSSVPKCSSLARLLVLLIAAVLVICIKSYSFPTGLNSVRKSASRLQMDSNTYIPLLVTTPKAKKKTTILVKRGEEEVINTIESWLNSGDNADEKMIDAWSDAGLVFRSTPLGVRAMHIAETKDKKKSQTIRKPSALKYALDMYIQAGTESEPVYIKASRSSVLSDLKSGVITVDQLRSTGDAFTNVTNLFVDERVTNRANDIATRLNRDFSIVSPEWKTWINKTAQYNATSLKQVMAAYFQEESIGDVGGKKAQYVPKRGHPGTLAPGENFKENNPFEDLPNRVLHPWPAMQQFQFHVRWAPSHPMLPPPLLFFGLNNMYTENFTNWQLSLPFTEIVGGLHMDAKDAIRIAKHCTIGMSYDPTEQLEHGGMIFPGRHILGNYHPDHGPTISEEKAKPPVPRELLPFSNRWVDPFFDLEQFHTKPPVEDELMLEAEKDEELRRLASERVLSSMMPKWVEKEASDSEKFESEVSDRVISWTGKQKKKRQETAEEYGVSEEDAEEEEDEALRIITEDAAKARRDVENEKAVSQVVLGKARGERALIMYTIEAVRDMSFEILRTEKDMATHKKSGRRKKRNKEKLSAVVVPPLDGEGEGEDSGLDGDLFEGDGEIESMGEGEIDVSAGLDIDLSLLADTGLDGSLPPLADDA